MYKIKVDDSRGVLTGKTSPQLLAILPGLEGRRKWVGGKLQFEATEHNLRVLKSNLRAEVEGDVAKVMEAFAVRAKRPPAIRKTEPMPHQSAALDHFGDKVVMALLMEQGTGKTKTFIDWCDDLWAAGEIDALLVVSRRGVHRQWAVGELPKHMSSPFSVAYWGQKGNPYPTGPGLKIITINWDGIKTPKGWEWVEEFCAKYKGRLVIGADESQDMKNYTTGRHKAMMEIKPYSSHRAIMTGTPIAKDLTDEWAQLRWLDENIIGVKYITTFRSQFCVMGGFQNKSVVGHKEMGAFRELTAPYVFRVTKEDIGLLPKQYDEWTFSMEKVQRDIIAQLKNEKKIELDQGTIDNNSAGVALIKAQQVSNGYFVDEDGVTHRLMPVEKNPRINAALDWLHGSDAKAIIWCRFREDIAMLEEALGKGFVSYHGGTKEDERHEAVASFLSTQGAQTLIASSAASTGLNLQGLCNRAMYYSEGWNAVDRWQKEDRIDRIGTIGFTVHTDLIAIGGTDRPIMRNRAKKKGISDLAIGGMNGGFAPAPTAPEASPEADATAILRDFLSSPAE